MSLHYVFIFQSFVHRGQENSIIMISLTLVFKQLTISSNHRLQCLPVVFVIFITLHSFVTTDGGTNIENEELRRKIESIMRDTLGANELQAHIEHLHFTFHPLDGKKVLKEVTRSINTRVTENNNALNLLKQAAESTFADSFANHTVKTSKVCQKDLNGKATPTVACFWGPNQHSAKPMVPPFTITNAMNENKRVQHLKRQLIATEEGQLFSSPPVKDYPRFYQQFRKVYISAVSPVPKDIVIVIDRSGSMARLHGNRSLLQITIDAVTSLLDTLNENDRVGVIVFDTGTVVPGVSIRKCVGTKLVKASIENIRFYQNIIQQIQTGARCNYELALRDAFQFFRNSNYSFRGEKREQVIMFLSDGLPTIGGDPVKVIAEENKILKNKVAVFTYAIGQSWNLTSLSVLRNMAWQVYSYPEYGEIKKGTFKHVVDPTKLKDEIGFYYREFVSKENDVATIIFKQYKHLQKAYMPYMFVCKQLHDTNYTVFGVTCLEISLTSFLREPVIFYNEQHSYAFMIDGKGRTILHSSLSKASSLEADEEFTRIEFFERDKGPVVESMKRGEVGQTFTYTTNAFSKGETSLSQKINVYWEPILHTNFSLCVVVADRDGTIIYNITPSTQERFHYHRGDATTDNRKACSHFNRQAVKEFSTVSLTPAAFIDPELYWGSDDNPRLRPSILDSVFITYFAEELWLNFHQHSSDTIWRFIGTIDGVLRVYPGIQIPDHYDHTQQPWFQKALASRDEVIVTGPYLDQWGSGHVITISKAIVKTITKNNSFVVGVMAIDISITHFHQLLTDSYPICKEFSTSCFVLDDTGYIAMHDDFVYVSTKVPTVEGVHITQKNPAIANHLLKNNIMTRRACLDILAKKTHYSFMVSRSHHRGEINYSEEHYKLLPVPKSNLFVVVEDQRYFNNQETCCSSTSTFTNEEQHCSKSDCPCVCFEEIPSNHCEDHLNLLRRVRMELFDRCSNANILNPHNYSDTPLCPSSSSQTAIELPHETDRALQLCFDPNCTRKSMQRRECFKSAGCSWCSRAENFTPLSEEYCTSRRDCYFGIKENHPPNSNKKEKNSQHAPDDRNRLPILLLAGLFCGVLVMTVVVVIILLMLKRKRKNMNSKHIPANLPVRPAENGYVVARVYPDGRPAAYFSRSQFGTVVYHHNFVFENST